MSFELSEELNQSKDYRDAFVDAHVGNGVAFQLKALRESRDWDQKDVARELGKPSAQPMISRYENPDYGKYSVSTLLELAHLYDVALIVKFAGFSELVKHDYESQSESFYVPSFEQECKAGLISNQTSTVETLPLAGLNAGSNILFNDWSEDESDTDSEHSLDIFTGGIIYSNAGSAPYPEIAL